MTCSSQLACINSILAGSAEDFPSDFVCPAARTEDAEQLLAALSVDKLYQVSDEILAGRYLILAPVVRTLLEQAGHEAMIQGRRAEGRIAIERLHRHSPDDVGVRLWLADTLAESGDPERILDLYTPILPSLIENPNAYSTYFHHLIIAALCSRRIDILSTLADNPPTSRVHTTALIDVALRRAVDLTKAGMSADELRTMSGPLGDALASAMLTLDEYGIINLVAGAALTAHGANLYDGAVKHSLVLAAITLQNGWSRAYRAALRLASSIVNATSASDMVQASWITAGLPPDGYDAFLITVAQHRMMRDGDVAEKGAARIIGEETLDKALQAFLTKPALNIARSVWSAAYTAGDHDRLARYAPAGGDHLSPAARVRAIVHAPAKRSDDKPMWVMMTWLKDADRLLRVLSAYVGQATVVVSVGGDGAPSDLRRMSALLLVEHTHLLSRPVVTWGGQRGGHHNIMEVMQAFSAMAAGDAWLQIVCDRTYPLQSLRRISRRTRESRIKLIQPGVGPPSWWHEWSNETVENLAERYHDALDEAFRTALPSKFLEMATRSPVYGDNDNRLIASVFNFTTETQYVNHGFWHDYMISALEIDVRWMSFARLQAFVDVSSESGATYTRRHHPFVTQWVQQVLSKYDLRTGSPWVYISQNFVKSVLSHPGLAELFSALDLGFAPEMNFFDTMAASLNLSDDFHHTYHTFPGTPAVDAELPAACVSADRDEFGFIRKTDPAAGAGLIRFFAERIYEDETCETLHWAASYDQTPEDGIGDPRPVLDLALIERLAGARIGIRDLFGRTRVQGRFLAGGRIAADDDSTLASWTFEGGTLRVDYASTEIGTKTYKLVGGEARTITLAPFELVHVGNRWSAFLDFDLTDIVSDPEVESVATVSYEIALGAAAVWLGSGNADAALLAAISDPEASDFPTPTLQAEGVIYEFRQALGGPLALASVDGFPTLLSVRGFAHGGGRTVLEFERATEAEALAWDRASSGPIVPAKLQPSGLVGTWTLTTLYDVQFVVFRSDNWISASDGDIIGRWFARADGIQILGLTGLIFGLADQFRLNRNIWHLSGWGWRNMKDSVSFSLKQLQQ